MTDFDEALAAVGAGLNYWGGSRPMSPDEASAYRKALAALPVLRAEAGRALEAAALKAESLDWTDPTEPDEGWLTDYIRTRVRRRSAAAIREVAAEVEE